MLLGDTCTRRCGFCSVATGRPASVDPSEAARVAEAVAELGLRYVVLTMVARDDLSDEGAGHVASVIHTVHEHIPEIRIEVLTSDFNGRFDLIAEVLEARPEVFAHNVETVERLTPSVRGRAQYRRSLEVLASAARWLETHGGGCVKTGLMVGLGESREELSATLKEIRKTGCSLLTVGQYLRPSRDSLAVERYLRPGEFDEIAEEARELGFAEVASGPLVRSSYRADALFAATEMRRPEMRRRGMGRRETRG